MINSIWKHKRTGDVREVVDLYTDPKGNRHVVFKMFSSPSKLHLTDLVDFKVYNEKLNTKPVISQSDLDHLKWMYERMGHVHKEEFQYDYMLKFKQILQQLQTERIQNENS